MGKTTIKELEEKHDKDVEDIEKKYVSKIAFSPVKAIVYGGVGLILIATLERYLSLTA